MYRRLLLAVPLAAALAAVSLGTAAGATPTSCFVGDRTHPFPMGETSPVTTLQAAVDAASPGDLLIMYGVCHGDTVINKNLTIRGRHIAGGARFPTPQTLDGTGICGSVLTILPGTTVTLDSVIVQGGSGGPGATGTFAGHFTVGGGIDNAGALTLRNVQISSNRASAGGGIFNENGTIAVSVYSSVLHNTATNPAAGGGGIYVDGGAVTADELQIAGNRAAGDGGGAYVSAPGSLTLVPASSVTANTATGDGGGIFNGVGATLSLGTGTLVSGNLPSDIFTL